MEIRVGKKGLWKYVLCYLNNENCCLNNTNKQALSLPTLDEKSMFFLSNMPLPPTVPRINI